MHTYSHNKCILMLTNPIFHNICIRDPIFHCCKMFFSLGLVKFLLASLVCISSQCETDETIRGVNIVYVTGGANNRRAFLHRHITIKHFTKILHKSKTLYIVACFPYKPGVSCHCVHFLCCMFSRVGSSYPSIIDKPIFNVISQISYIKKFIARCIYLQKK